jgi:hypothetical protein
MSVTLAQLRTSARQRADMENSTKVTDVELNEYINKSAAELYDLLVLADPDYYTTTALFSLTSASNVYTVPADFYKLRGVDYQADGADYVTIHPFNLMERNRLNRTLLRNAVPLRRYRLMKNTLWFVPESDASGNYRLWYLPVFVDLALDGTVIDAASIGLQHWEEYVTTDAAIKCMQKEESDVSVLMAQKQALTARITTMARSRDVGEPERVADVTGDGSYDGGFGWDGWRG